MSQHLSRQALASILQTPDLSTLSAAEIVRLFQEEMASSDFLPDGVYQIDPRTGDRILYNTSRSRRPHDNRPLSPRTSLPKQACAVCSANTTGVIDVAPLSEGFTFINKNLYPALFPQTGHVPPSPDVTTAKPAFGLHFLQWTSNYHDYDWHNMPRDDLAIVLQRLAALEQHLYQWGRQWLAEQPGYVSIIKNYGHLVGSSLAHGHQQITFSSVMPARVQDHVRFQEAHGEPFSAFLMRMNPPELTLQDYGPALLLVPYYMRRPYDMLLLLKDTHKRYIYQLSADELRAVAQGWHDALAAIHHVMPQIGRELAYNVLCHNGPGAGLYFEFLPYTQENGGFEHLGLVICQNNPTAVATHLANVLNSLSQPSTTPAA